MLGTDSMSEGLNLQTCARVINYDLPWNFMRVEQRIGRVDRIGGQPRRGGDQPVVHRAQSRMTSCGGSRTGCTGSPPL